MVEAANPRPELVAVSDQATADLAAVWAESVPPGASAEYVRDFLLLALPALGSAWCDAAASAAADWYDSAREKAQAVGRFVADLAPQPDVGRWDSLARWGVEPMFQPTPRSADALTLVQGGLQRTVAGQHRDTIAQATIADPAARGWQRVGIGETCDFCQMLIGRGGVYTSATVKFRTHDHCRCAAAPVWNLDLVDISHVGDAYTPGERQRKRR